MSDTRQHLHQAVQAAFEFFDGKGDAQPIALRPKFGGKTFDESKDGERLKSHLERVFNVMKDGKWRTLGTIHKLSKPGSEAGTSSRIRDLRKPQFGGYTILSKRGDKDSVWLYRLVI